MSDSPKKIDVGGRPPKYKTAKELQVKINEYLNDNTNAPFTITGLSLFLGFESRQSMYDLEKIEKFSYTIKRARHYIENNYEQLLACGGGAGIIFALKNLGWKDKTEQDINLKEVKSLEDFYNE